LAILLPFVQLLQEKVITSSGYTKGYTP